MQLIDSFRIPSGHLLLTSSEAHHIRWQFLCKQVSIALQFTILLSVAPPCMVGRGVEVVSHVTIQAASTSRPNLAHFPHHNHKRTSQQIPKSIRIPRFSLAFTTDLYPLEIPRLDTRIDKSNRSPISFTLSLMKPPSCDRPFHQFRAKDEDAKTLT
jgi:hypothetical protein